MRRMLRMQEEKSQRLENTHERRNETQSYSDILHGNIHGRKNRTPMQEIRNQQRKRE